MSDALLSTSDALLSTEDQKEALSRVYVHAVAAVAGYATAELDFDRDGVDVQIHAGGAMRPALDLQLKATVNLRVAADGDLRFTLPRQNYDLLRLETQTPRLLVVLDLPDEPSRWVTITDDELVLRRRAFWLNLRGHEATDNQSSVTVRIPRQNLFNVQSLRALMDQSRGGIIQ